MSTRQQLLISLLSESLAESALSTAEHSPYARFDDLGMDSLDLTEFFLRVEGQFDVSFAPDEIASIVSLAALDACLTRKAIPE